MTERKEKLEIDERVTFCESFVRITTENSADAGNEDGVFDDLFGMMSEGDRVRLSYQILYKKIKFADMKKTNDLMLEGEYSRIDKGELLLDFLKRHKLMKEICALHSRSRAVHMMREFKETGEFPSYTLLKNSFPLGILMPNEKIRSYYGDGVAMYFEFMNFFLRWMFYPAIFGAITWICN